MAILALILSLISSDNHDPLLRYRWKNRVVVLTSADQGNSSLKEQKELFEQFEDEFIDRDMVMVVIHTDFSQISDRSTTAAEHKALIRRFTPQENFNIFLVGKDGGVKYKNDGVTNPLEVFQLIDSMPMRRSEMKSNQK